MRRTRSNLIKVGLLVVVAGGLLAAGLLWIAGARVFRAVSTYTVLFDESVSGLNAGANVEYQGVVVGRVRDIQLTTHVPPKVAVIVDIEPGTPVRSDTQAALLGSLVTGIKYIQFRGGTSNGGLLPPQGIIRGEVPSLELFRDRLTEIADRVVDILRGLDDHVFTDENARRLSAFLTDMGAVAASLNKTMEMFRPEDTSRDLLQLVQRLTRAADTANAILTDFHSRRGAIYGRLETALGDLGATVRQTRELVRGTEQEVSATGGSIGTLVAELTLVTRQLQETLDVLRSDPSLLLWSRPVPEREIER